MQSTNTQCPHNHQTLFAAVAVDIQRNSFGNSGIEAVADPAVLLGHMLVVDSLFVGNLKLPGIPGCSCSIGCMPQYHTVAVAAVGCNLIEILIVGADCSSVGYVVCAVDMTDFDGRKIDADDNRHCHHSLHHHNPLTKEKNLCPYPLPQILYLTPQSLLQIFMGKLGQYMVWENNDKQKLSVKDRIEKKITENKIISNFQFGTSHLEKQHYYSLEQTVFHLLFQPTAYPANDTQMVTYSISCSKIRVHRDFGSKIQTVFYCFFQIDTKISYFFQAEGYQKEIQKNLNKGTYNPL